MNRDAKSSNSPDPDSRTLPSHTRDFRRRIIVGFAFVVILGATIGIASLVALRSVIAAKDLVISEYAHDLELTRDLELASERNASSSRAFLLTGDPRYLEKAREARGRFTATAEGLKATTTLPVEAHLLAQVVDAAAAHQAALDEAISAERVKGNAVQVADLFEAEVRPKREALQIALGEFVHEKERLLTDTVTRSRNDVRETMLFIAALGSVAAVIASLLFFFSMRTLRQLARAEVEIRDLNEHLEKRVQERTREIEGFAYTVAHDLRAPLRAMAGFSDIIADESGQALGDSARESLRRIRRAALRMDELIQGILSLARLSYQSFRRISVDLSEIVREVVEVRNKEILEAGALVELQASTVRALGDPSLLVLTMDHLLTNALKFVSPGVKPHILIQIEAQGTSARVSVRDNGIGISPGYHKRVFGVFERLHPNDAFPGVGVGLALVQRAVQRMGGVVGVEANPEGGATFWIELDVAAAAEGTPQLLPSSSGRS